MDAASAAAGRITREVATSFTLVGVERLVTVSIGLATAETGERSIDSLLRDGLAEVSAGRLQLPM